jgi:hypothetical protein
MTEREPELQAAQGDDRPAGETSPAGVDRSRGGPAATAIIVWAVTSVALLTFVMVGSTPTYVWRFNRKYEESKSILSIWGVEADNLPRVAHQWAIDGAFFAALGLFLAGVITCLWFLVSSEDRQDAAASGPGPT